jgi:hypothetical protein
MNGREQVERGLENLLSPLANFETPPATAA